MKEKMKEALIQEIKRHVNTDILYDDVYVGPLTERDCVDCAYHGVGWYLNTVWHDASKEPLPPGKIIVEKTFGGVLVGWTTDDQKGIEDEHGTLITKEIRLWAFIDDLLPTEMEALSDSDIYPDGHNNPANHERNTTKSSQKRISISDLPFISLLFALTGWSILFLLFSNQINRYFGLPSCLISFFVGAIILIIYWIKHEES